jgi:UDP-3-O-[3-hydroxymyristoyl] glucosamine N-acyltransferase
LAEAGPREVSFLANPRYRPQLATTRAAAVVVGLDEPRAAAAPAFLRIKDPNRAFTRIVQRFAPAPTRPTPGVHSSASVDSSARIDPLASIGPGCVVGPRARIGAGAWLLAQVHVGADAIVGADSVLHPMVVLYERVVLGAKVVVHAGSVIGSDGFGWEPTREGWEKIPQCGTVVVEDEVEIGANCAIDRARFGATRIGRGAKLDNLVHVAHNVVVGRAALLVAQVGVAGSAKVGERAILAGQAGVQGHAEIGAGARIGGQAGVFGDVPPGEDWAGWPARPKGATLRSAALVARLPELVERLRALEARIAAMEPAAPRGKELR